MAKVPACGNNSQIRSHSSRLNLKQGKKTPKNKAPHSLQRSCKASPRHGCSFCLRCAPPRLSPLPQHDYTSVLNHGLPYSLQNTPSKIISHSPLELLLGYRTAGSVPLTDLNLTSHVFNHNLLISYLLFSLMGLLGGSVVKNPWV